MDNLECNCLFHSATRKDRSAVAMEIYRFDFQEQCVLYCDGCWNYVFGKKHVSNKYSLANKKNIARLIAFKLKHGRLRR